jgi:hypothetical protein
MGFFLFEFLPILVIIYLLWRIMDQQPDVLFRVSEIQRDIAEIRRHLQDSAEGPADVVPPPPPSSASPSSPPPPADAPSPGEGPTA